MPVDVAELRAEHFRPFVDGSFTIEFAPGVSFEARLVRCDEHGAAAPGMRRSFSLLFRTAAGAPPRQGIYRLTHAELGTFELFLTVQRPPPDGAHYEIVFG